jgi:hypothetical protein
MEATMTRTKTWNVEIFVFEEGDVTKARAVLDTGAAGVQHLEGLGQARRRPTDSDVPEIGDELAAARALSDLSHQLLDTAARDIEAIEHKPVHLKS